MSTNLVYDSIRGLSLTATAPASPASGGPLLVGRLAGVAIVDELSAGTTSVDLGPGVYDLSVNGSDDAGNVAVAAGDRIYYTDGDTPKLSRKSSGTFFGIALEAVTSGSTTTINVLVGGGLAGGNLFADNERLVFGTGGDAAIFWNGSRLNITPAAVAGGDSPKGVEILQEVLSGTGAFRQGALSVQINRAAAQADTTWDGNPDCGLKLIATNRATGNVASEGAVRGIDAQARNRGTNINWVNAANFNARNDSGMQAVSLWGVMIRVENYGNVGTDIVGLDINLSDENANVDPHTTTGILVRNTDASGMPAADSGLKLSHTSTNGFDAMLEAAAVTGDGVTASTTTPTGAAAYALHVKINGTVYYGPLYTAIGFGG